MKSDLFWLGSLGGKFQLQWDKGRRVICTHKGWQTIHCNFLHSKSHSFPSTQRPPIPDLQSFVWHQVARTGTASGRWNLVFDRHHMQLDSHCAPRKRPHPVEHVSCSGLHLGAETTMTHRLHRPLHYARWRRDPRLETLSGWLFLKISPLDIQSSPVSFLTLCRHRVSPQQLAG